MKRKLNRKQLELFSISLIRQRQEQVPLVDKPYLVAPQGHYLVDRVLNRLLQEVPLQFSPRAPCLVALGLANNQVVDFLVLLRSLGQAIRVADFLAAAPKAEAPSSTQLLFLSSEVRTRFSINQSQVRVKTMVMVVRRVRTKMSPTRLMMSHRPFPVTTLSFQASLTSLSS